MDYKFVAVNDRQIFVAWHIYVGDCTHPHGQWENVMTFNMKNGQIHCYAFQT